LQFRLNDLVAIIGSDQAREAFRRMSRSVEGVARKGGEKEERENLGSPLESVSEGSSGIKQSRGRTRIATTVERTR
jgi:hypothetical protein